MLKMKENEIVEENLYSLSYDYLNIVSKHWKFKLQNQLYKGVILGEYYVNTSLEGSKNNDVTSPNSLISANRRQTNTNTIVCIIQKPCFKPKLSYIYYKKKKIGHTFTQMLCYFITWTSDEVHNIWSQNIIVKVSSIVCRHQQKNNYPRSQIVLKSSIFIII